MAICREVNIDLGKFEQEIVDKDGRVVKLKRDKADHTIRVMRPKLYTKVSSCSGSVPFRYSVIFPSLRILPHIDI